MKKIAIFDLDGTVIDSEHRTPNKADGTLDLERYFELKTRENIFRDTVLPLADRMKEMILISWLIIISNSMNVSIGAMSERNITGVFQMPSIKPSN
jgi:hypothetical protein